MCGSQPNVDNSAAEAAAEEARQARVREEERQARITDGTTKINDTFGTFTDDFFTGLRDTYMDYYQPQLDQQFGKASDDLTFSLARAGTLNSSIAGQKQAELTTQYNDSLASILSQAQGAADDQRARVGQEKSSLISLLNSTADADMVSNEALARTQSLFNERPTYNPLGDMFGGVATGVGQYLQNQQNKNLYNAYMGGGSAGSSARIVR